MDQYSRGYRARASSPYASTVCVEIRQVRLGAEDDVATPLWDEVTGLVVDGEIRPLASVDVVATLLQELDDQGTPIVSFTGPVVLCWAAELHPGVHQATWWLESAPGRKREFQGSFEIEAPYFP